MSMRAQETTGDEKRHEDRIDAGDQQQAGPYHAVVAGLNDLETVCPELISRWDYEKNEPEGLRPSEIRPKVGRWAWWRCEHGHSWRVTVKGVVLLGRQCALTAMVTKHGPATTIWLHYGQNY